MAELTLERSPACGAEAAVRERAGVSGRATSAGYEIRVEGVLDQRWTAWFEDLEIASDHNQTVISGPVTDQAALHGLLNRVCDLGLVLVSVRRLEPSDPDDRTGARGLGRARPAGTRVTPGPATSTTRKRIDG